MFQQKLRVLPRIVAVFALVVGVWASGSAHAGPAMDRLNATVQSALQILQTHQGVAPAQRREALRQALFPRFDFPVMARSAVGPQWRSFSPDQKQRFIALFRRILENTYIDKVESYGGESVQFTGEIPQNDRVVSVSSVVSGNGQQYRMDYRMILREGDWRVFDVTVEGIGMIANYRSQFQQILNNQGPDGLLSVLSNRGG